MTAKKGDKPQYYKANMDLDEELAFLNDYTSQGDIPRIKLEFGDLEVRFGPAYNEQGEWFHFYATHWDLPIEGEKTTFRCAQTQSEPEECLFCTAADVYKDANPDLFKKWRAKPRYDFNAYVLGEEDEGFKVLSLPPSAAKDLLDACKKSIQRGVDPTDPEDGYSFIVTKSKTGNKAYNVDYSFWANPMEGGGPIKDWAILDTLINLAEIFPAPSLEKQQEYLQIEGEVAGEEQKRLPAGDEKEDVIQEVVEDKPIDVEVVEEEEAAPKVSPSDLLRQRLTQQAGKGS